MDWLVSNNKRNIIIRNLSITQKGNTLVLFQYVEKHGRIIFDMINNKIGDTRKVFFVFGGTDTDTREQIRAITENENSGKELTFGTLKLFVKDSEEIPLSDKSIKLGKDITVEDDICDYWLKSKFI
jgi:hypothetical protein